MRILLVENEKRMTEALCELLRLEKYEVDHFANGLDGLAAIESHHDTGGFLWKFKPCFSGMN